MRQLDDEGPQLPPPAHCQPRQGVHRYPVRHQHLLTRLALQVGGAAACTARGCTRCIEGLRSLPLATFAQSCADPSTLYSCHGIPAPPTPLPLSRLQCAPLPSVPTTMRSRSNRHLDTSPVDVDGTSLGRRSNLASFRFSNITQRTFFRGHGLQVRRTKSREHHHCRRF